VKLLEQEEKRLKGVLIKTEYVERASSVYVEELEEKQRQSIESSEMKNIHCKNSDP